MFLFSRRHPAFLSSATQFCVVGWESSKLLHFVWNDPAEERAVIGASSCIRSKAVAGLDGGAWGTRLFLSACAVASRIMVAFIDPVIAGFAGALVVVFLGILTFGIKLIVKVFPFVGEKRWSSKSVVFALVALLAAGVFVIWSCTGPFH